MIIMNSGIVLLQEFLLHKGFAVTADESYSAFGDHFLEMCSDQLCIKVIRDKSVEHIEIGRSDHRDISYDMDILRSYILGEDWLTSPRDIRAETEFVTEYFDSISDCFSNIKYLDNQVSLEKLKIERGKRMFPRWFEKS
jgi:hypothetical protein